MSDPFISYLDRRDRVRFSAFVSAYIETVTRMARRIVPSEDMAEDVVQESFLRLSRATTKSANVKNPRAFVLKTVLNVARSILRREKTRSFHENRAGRERDLVEPSTAETVLSQEESQLLYDCIDQLPEEFRLTIHLRMFEGLSYQEIASITGVPVKTVGSRVHRAKNQLQRLVGGAGTAIVVTELALVGAREMPGAPSRDLEARVVERGPLAPAPENDAAGLWHSAPQIIAKSSPYVIVSVATVLLLLAGPSRPPDDVSLRADQQRAQGSSSTRSSVDTQQASEPKGRAMERSRRLLAATLSLGLAAVSPVLTGEPGQLVAHLSSEAVGPVDMAHDDVDDTFWVTSATEFEVYQYNRELTTVIKTVPIPFENAVASFAYGITINSIDGTLLVMDALSGELHEITKDGAPTDRIIDFESRDAMGLAFDAGGNDGNGSIYVVMNEGASVLETTLDGVTLRSFPDRSEIEAVLGAESRVRFNDVEPIKKEGELSGFHLLGSSDDRYAILRLNALGEIAETSISLRQAGGEVNSLLSRPFRHPESGEIFDAYVCTTVVGSRFLVFESGEPSFLPLRDLQCSAVGPAVELKWLTSETYDSIEIVRGCEVLATVPGDATSWSLSLPDGEHKLAVRAYSGFNSTQTRECTVIVGAGQVIASSETLGHLGFMTSSDDGELVIATGQSLIFLGRDLQEISRSEISSFFLAEGDSIGGLSPSGIPERFLIYNATTHSIGSINNAGSVVSSVGAQLPSIGTDPAQDVDRGRVSGIAYDARGRGGQGSIWVVETKRRMLYELDVAGNLIRELPHPYNRFEFPNPSDFNTSGVAVNDALGARELYLSGAFADGRTDIFRFNVETEEIVSGSWITPASPGAQDIALIGDFDRGDLFIFDGRIAHAIETALPEVRRPTLFVARQRTHSNNVELTFVNNGPYDRIDVYRSCEKIAELSGSSRAHVDVDAPPGRHEYRVQGIREGIASDFATDSVTVGVGAVLTRRLTEPLVDPGQIAYNPADGTFFVVQRLSAGTTEPRLYYYDADLIFLDSFVAPLEPGWQVHTIAIRMENDQPLLYAIISRGGVDALFRLASMTVDGELVDEVETTPPGLGYRWPLGLTWDPLTDTFYYMEGNTDAFTQIDLTGRTLREFPHPLPPPNHLVINHGVTLSPKRRTLLTTAMTIDDFDAEVLGCARCPSVSKIVEMSLSGSLTGYEIPIDRQEFIVTGITLVEDEILALSNRGVGEIVRMKAFPESVDPAEALFLRGDCNSSGDLDLSDAIFSLRHLFAGEHIPECVEACNANDDEDHDVSDAIFLLTYLFVGGGERLDAPSPECGQDDEPAKSLGCDFDTCE